MNLLEAWEDSWQLESDPLTSPVVLAPPAASPQSPQQQAADGGAALTACFGLLSTLFHAGLFEEHAAADQDLQSQQVALSDEGKEQWLSLELMPLDEDVSLLPPHLQASTAAAQGVELMRLTSMDEAMMSMWCGSGDLSKPAACSDSATESSGCQQPQSDVPLDQHNLHHSQSCGEHNSMAFVEPLAPATADLMEERLSVANGVIRSREAEVASLQAQIVLLRQLVEHQQTQLDVAGQADKQEGPFSKCCWSSISVCDGTDCMIRLMPSHN